MNRHIVTVTDFESEQLFLGTINYLFKFFKKKPGFIDKLSVGNIVFFKKKKGEILGQFEVGKIIIIERVENRDWRLVKEITGGSETFLSKEKFQELVEKNSILLIIQIDKLEQFITSPIEIDKRSKKGWIVLE